MFRAKFETNTLAFHEASSHQSECAKILRRIADELEAGELDGYAVDSHDNHVGSFDLSYD